MTNKVLVQVACASHALLYEGCSQQRCTPASDTPYGGPTGAPWAGPQSTLKAALIEWIKGGTFNGAANGQFLVDESGVVSAGPWAFSPTGGGGDARLVSGGRNQPMSASFGSTSSAIRWVNSTGCRSGVTCTSVTPSAAYSATSARNASTSSSGGR